MNNFFDKYKYTKFFGLEVYIYKYDFYSKLGTRSLANLNNGYLVAGSYISSLYLFDINNYKLVKKYDASSGSHSGMIFTMILLDNGYLATGSNDSTIKIWDTNSLKRF